jgi:hypothetical protein
LPYYGLLANLVRQLPELKLIYFPYFYKMCLIGSIIFMKA